MTVGPEREGGPPMPRAPRRAWSSGSVGVALVAVLAGVLFATNAALFRGGEGRHPENLADLVAIETERLAAVTEDVTALRSEVDALITAARGQSDAVDDPGDEFDVASGQVAVSGPGVVVRLWDAPTTNLGPGVRPDDLVVHQQDLEAVMNALWAGGAETMSIQGNRMTSQTAVRCVGNVLLLESRTYSPPYEVAAIGDAEDLLQALDESPGVQIYLQYVAAVGLGYSAEARERIDMPAAEAGSGVRHVDVIGDGQAVRLP